MFKMSHCNHSLSSPAREIVGCFNIMTQISSFAVATLTVLLMFLILSSSVSGTLINVQNKCGQVLTACDAAGGDGGPGTPGFIPTSCYVLGAFGGSRLRDFGSKWTGGLIWGFPGSNPDPGLGDQAKTVANKMEMTTDGQGSGQDSYNLSNVDGYNLPLLVNPTSDVPRSGLHCGTPICQIPNLNQVCGNPNFFSGFPAFGCKNVDGGGTRPTPGTQFFKNPCMSSYSFSSDSVVFGCETGTNYEVVFCP